MSTTAWTNRWIVAVAALIGALIGVAALPRARSTAEAELDLALGRRPEWMKAAEGGTWKPIERVVAANPNDFDIQLAAATLPPRGTLAMDKTNDLSLRGSVDEAAVTVQRLQALAKRFPQEPRVWAHLLRHLTRKAIWIERPEEAEVIGIRATRRSKRLPRVLSPAALQLFQTAVDEGRRLGPENGFFDAMRAGEEFAVRKDEDALRDFQSASEKPRWNDYATEETEAQWKLLASAYGDRGAAQKERPFESLLFPQYNWLRQSAHLAIWHAAQAERRGENAKARTIRHAVMQIGMRLAEYEPTVIGKYAGLALAEDSGAPVPPDHRSLSAPTQEEFERKRRERRERYERQLRAEGQIAEADWVHAQRERADALAARLQETRLVCEAIAPIPFSPAGWAGWWTLGIMLLRQIAALLALWVAAVLTAGRPSVTSESEGHSASLGWAALGMALLVIGYLLIAAAPFYGIVWSKLDLGLLLQASAAILVLWSAVQLAVRRSRRKGDPQPRGAALWVSVITASALAPVLLWSMTGSDFLFQITLATGLGSMGLLGLSRLAGDRAGARSGVPRWCPELVALLAVLPSAGLLFMIRDRLSSSDSFTTILLGRTANLYFWQPETDPGQGVPALVLLPAALLLLVQLCRVAALKTPLRIGMARGLRRTAPIAAGLLLAAYVASLVPALHSDRVMTRVFDQLLRDPLSVTSILR